MVWLSVCIQLVNRHAYPAHSEDVLAALPIQATRVVMNGTRVRDFYTTFFNLRTAHAVRAVSHKVSAAEMAQVATRRVEVA